MDAWRNQNMDLPGFEPVAPRYDEAAYLRQCQMIEACLGRADGKVVFPEGFNSWSTRPLVTCMLEMKGAGWTSAAIAEVAGVTRQAVDALLRGGKMPKRGFKTATFENGIRLAVLWFIVTVSCCVPNAPRRRATADRTELSRCASRVRAALVSERRRAG